MKRWISLVLSLILIALPLCALCETAQEPQEKPWMGYASILDLFYSAAADQWGGDRLINSGFDPDLFPAELEQAAFLLKDLDGDETYELILLNPAQTELTPVLSVYTIKNDMPVRLISSYVRARVYLLEDGRLYLERSDSADRSQFCLYALSEDKLVMEKAVYCTEYEKDGETLFGWFETTDDKHRYAAAEEAMIDEEAAQSFRQAAEELKVTEFAEAFPLQEYNP